jgi:hypothetical protein
MLIFKTEYHIILLNSLYIMFEIKGYHGCDNAQYLWVGCDKQSETNLDKKKVLNLLPSTFL